ncbi:transcriptional regulator domain-containing protein [Sphingomonas adhaesiva]|uniref:transcriptional regulator domain-containing protein n=1 Tax=Sphingomonas adhaesiva TaxID=28212 RepID=UPI003FA6B21C
MVRSCPQPADLTDPRAFAWEVLRRRADYRSIPAEIRLIASAGPAPLELIVPAETSNRWGLRFRRSP